MPTDANQVQCGVSQSICISDTHIFLNLYPSAYVCLRFFVSKMDMVITRLLAVGGEEEIPGVLPLAQRQRRVPFSFPLRAMHQAMPASPPAPASASGDFGRRDIHPL